MKFLKSIDIYGKEFKFTISGGKLTSWVGGLITILFLCSFLACLGYFGKDIYYKKFPKIISEYLHLSKSPYYELSNFEEPLTFKFQLHPENYLFPIVYFYSENNLDINSIDYPYKIQKDFEIDEEGYSYFNHYGPFGHAQYDNQKKLYNENYSSKNFTSRYSYLKFKLLKCNDYFNATEKKERLKNNITCPSESDYQNMREMKNINMYYKVSSNIFYAKNFSQPNKKFFKEFATEHIDLGSILHSYMGLSVIEVNSDEGFLFEDVSTKYFQNFNQKIDELIIGDN